MYFVRIMFLEKNPKTCIAVSDWQENIFYFIPIEHFPSERELEESGLVG